MIGTKWSAYLRTLFCAENKKVTYFCHCMHFMDFNEFIDFFLHFCVTKLGYFIESVFEHASPDSISLDFILIMTPCKLISCTGPANQVGKLLPNRILSHKFFTQEL